VLKVICGLHNHDFAETLVGHPYAGRLKLVERALVVDMTKSLVKPSNILLTLKQNNEDNVTTIKQLYNVRYTYKRFLRGLRTVLYYQDMHPLTVHTCMLEQLITKLIVHTCQGL